MSGHHFGSQGLRDNIAREVEWALATPEQRAQIDTDRFMDWAVTWPKTEYANLIDNRDEVTVTEDGWLGVPRPITMHSTNDLGMPGVRLHLTEENDDPET